MADVGLVSVHRLTKLLLEMMATWATLIEHRDPGWGGEVGSSVLPRPTWRGCGQFRVIIPGGWLTHWGPPAEKNTVWKSLESLSHKGQVRKWGFVAWHRESSGEVPLLPSRCLWPDGGEPSHVCAAPDDEEEVSDNKTI